METQIELKQNKEKPFNGISIIIPTYNNSLILFKCLEAIEIQSFPLDLIEVIVIVDGSTDETVSALKKFEMSVQFDFIFIEQHNQGPGPARNAGIKQARHDLILIINDDFIADQNLI